MIKVSTENGVSKYFKHEVGVRSASYKYTGEYESNPLVEANYYYDAVATSEQELIVPFLRYYLSPSRKFVSLAYPFTLILLSFFSPKNKS